MPQMPLFENEPLSEPDDRGLVLQSRPDRPLTKAQRTFNRLVSRVEELRARLEKETQGLDKALAYYGSNLHPRLQRLNALRKDMVRSLSLFLNGKQLKRKSERKTLRMIIGDQFNGIIQEEGPLTDDDLRTIFERVFGLSYERAEREEMEDTRALMDEMFADLGIDVDFSDLRPDMSEEEMASKAAEMAEKLHQKVEAKEEEYHNSKRRMSRKQLEREQRAQQAEQLRKKNIGSIYKQLARVLHPDLELDAARREQKVVLMQELTVAYKNNDLHTLLRMELEWIQHEESNIARLTDEKLSVYNQVLRDQVSELEQEIEALRHHPRYQPLIDPSDMFGRLRTDGPSQARELDQIAEGMAETLARLKTPQALDEVLEAIREYRSVNRDPF